MARSRVFRALGRPAALILLPLALAGCLGSGSLVAAREHRGRIAVDGPGRGHRDRRRLGARRADPAAVGLRPGRGRRPKPAQRRRTCADRVPEPGPDHPGQGRPRHPRRRARGGERGRRRRRRADHRSALRRLGAGRRASGAAGGKAPRRLLDRCEHRDARRLSAELPAAGGSRPDRRLRRVAGPPLDRGAHPGDDLRQRRRGPVPRGGRPPRRPCRRDRALSARPAAGRRPAPRPNGDRQRAPRRTRCSSPRTATASPPSDRRSRRPASTRSA